MIKDILQRLAVDWSTPRPATHRGQTTVFNFRCTVKPGPTHGDAGVKPPPALADFWAQASSARLFEDATYGQWGLVLLPPEVAAKRSAEFQAQRPKDCIRGDLVLGEFLGDQDLLVVRCDPEAPDYGHVIVALPLDERADWDEVAVSLTDFLGQYERAEGAKYWEP